MAKHTKTTSSTFFYRYRMEILLVIAAVAARIVFAVLQSQTDPLFLQWSVDEKTYLDDARRFADAGFSRAGLKLPFWQPPGYTLILAAWLGAGGSAAAFVFMQGLLGVASAWLIYRIIVNMFGDNARRHGAIASLLFSFFPAILYYETKLLKPAWVIFLMLWIVYLSMPRSREGWWPLRGVLAGLLVIFDVYFIVVPVALILVSRMKRGPLLAIAAGLLVTMGPVAALNASANAGFVVVSYNGPINLYVGNNEQWTETYNTLPGWPWYQITLKHEDAAGADRTNVGTTGGMFIDDVVRYAADHPLAFARGFGEKALMFFSLRELPRNGSIFMHPVVLWLGSMMNAAALLIAFICLPRLKREPVIMLLLVTIVAVNVLFFPTTRYRLPAVPLALIAIGALAGRPARWVKRTTFFVVVLATAATMLASRLVDYDAWQAFSLNEAAWVEIRKGDATQAEALIGEALKAERLADALDTAGQIAMEHRRDPKAALALFEEASGKEPDLPRPYFNQARIQLQSKQWEEAYRLHNRYLNLIRPELPDFTAEDARAALQSLEFNARMDFERGRLSQALARLNRIKKIHAQHPVEGITISGLDRQIEMIEARLGQR